MARRIRMGIGCASLALAIVIAGCASWQDGPPQIALPYVQIFSKNQPAEDGKLPDGWRRWSISKLKKPTKYKLVEYNGRTVVEANAEASASGLIHRLDIDAKEFPVLAWQWKAM